MAGAKYPLVVLVEERTVEVDLALLDVRDLAPVLDHELGVASL